MSSVLISIVNYKNHAVTVECLRSLEKIGLHDIELSVVVVNNDTGKPFQYEWKGPGSYVILDQQENLGFAGGHNISLSRGLFEKVDYVMVLNNDTTIKPSYLEELVAAAEEHAEAGILAPKIYFAAGDEFHKDRYQKSDLGKVIWYGGGQIDWQNLIISHRGVDEVDSGQFDTPGLTDFASGCCMLIRCTVLEKVGKFDERYFLYLEDSDLNERVKRAGYKIFYIPNSVVWHKNAGSTGGSGSELQDYFITRNRLLFGYRYAPVRTKLALFRESMSMLRSGREWQRIGAKDYYAGRFGRGSYKV
jgi:GT2 family glycosyltransferase